MELTDFLGDVAIRQVRYFPALVPICGSVTATVLFGQLYYWTKIGGKDPEGWIYKSQAELTQETALTREEQETARKYLKKSGILHEQKKGIPCRLFYRLDLKRVNELYKKHQLNQQNGQMPQTRMRDSRKQDCGNAACKDEAKPQTTTLDYAENYQGDYSSSRDNHTAAAPPSSLSPNPQPLHPEVTAAIEKIPGHLRQFRRDAELIAQTADVDPARVARNIRLIAARPSPAGKLLRAAIRDDYSAAEPDGPAPNLRNPQVHHHYYLTDPRTDPSAQLVPGDSIPIGTTVWDKSLRRKVLC
ncbi:hypothetical protein FO488_15890 [Geobacter sp. FeAm09]|uniref:hypothetical protein n=1 Tax=Geobacter sp. FeAm09 TaxID=2597769 RepID=UPI0011ECD777|nr:hypothetical protein [Geobacter sp. FeAm09]QEM69489.1 hypothetical protein FO488_15890 [Geobacter sp. FeAm09]